MASSDKKSSVQETTKAKETLFSESQSTTSNERRKFASEPDIGASNPFDFSAMSGLLNDPSIKELAEQIAKDPAFNQMAQQLQQSAQTSGQECIPQLDTENYFSAMQHVMQNPQFMAMAEQLGNALMQDPSMSSMFQNLTDPSHKEQVEARMARIREDPTLKPILDEIESGGPAAMMKYWNDPAVLAKLGQAMGVGISEDTPTNDRSGPDQSEGDNDYEDDEELTVHHTASVGDVEVLLDVYAKHWAGVSHARRGNFDSVHCPAASAIFQECNLNEDPCHLLHSIYSKSVIMNLKSLHSCGPFLFRTPDYSLCTRLL